MTLPVFPILPGRDFLVKRSPKASTIRQPSISGRETFQPKWPYPLYDIELAFNALTGGPASAWGGAREWQAFEDFWKSCMFAPGGVFQFTDPNDNAVTEQATGTGDGATLSFQLLRALATFAEPVLLPLTAALFKSDWQGNQLQYTTARTNLLLYAQDMTNAAWTASNATVTGAAGTAPDGTNTAVSVNDTSATQIGDADQAVAVANDAATYTVSAFVKAGGGPIAAIRAGLTGGAAVTVVVAFDPATGNWTAGGAALAAPPTVTNMGSGWWRVSFQIANNASGNTSLVLRLRPAHAAALATPVNQIGTITPGDATQTGAQLFWGAQIEAGAVITSYIKTTSAAVTVTDYALEPGGIVLFAVAPLLNAALSWTGTYAWLCRFSEDSLEFDNFMYQLWELKKCRFETARL